MKGFQKDIPLFAQLSLWGFVYIAATLPSARRGRTGRAIWSKKNKKKKDSEGRAANVPLGEYLWIGKNCRHVAHDRQEKEYGAVILIYQPGQADIHSTASRSYLLPGRATFLAKPIQNIQFYYCVHLFFLSKPRKKKTKRSSYIYD